MDTFCQPIIPIKSSKFLQELTTRNNKQGKFCSCCHRIICDSFPCEEKSSSLDPTRKINNNDHNASYTILESVLSKIEQKCKCTEQTYDQYRSSDANYLKPRNWNQDSNLKKLKYLCGVPSNLSLKREKNYDNQINDETDPGKLHYNNTDSIQRKKSLELKENAALSDSSDATESIICNTSVKCCFIDTELEKTVKIVQRKFEEELKTLLNIEGNISFYECEKDRKCNCVKKIQNEALVDTLPETITCGQTIKICKRRSPIILHGCHHYEPHSSLQKEVKPFKLDDLGKSDEIGKWGKCLDLVDEALAKRDETMSKLVLSGKIQDNIQCESMIKKTETEETCFRDGICLTFNEFENVNRVEDIGNCGFSILSRRLMRWTNCMTKLWRETKRKPHIVVHLPSFACPDHLRCRAKKNYSSLQNIQIGRLGWLKNRTTQVLYVCPDNINLDLHLLRRLVSVARPDIDLDNLWLIQPEKDVLVKDCSTTCENLFSTPATYRRVRNLTAGRQSFIIPGLLDKKDVFIACELKIAILGPCLNFQKRLQSKKYTMNVLASEKIDQPPCMGFNNFNDLCRNLSIMILKHPIYKLWFIKLDCGFHGYQTAIFQINKSLYKEVNKAKCREKELADLLVTLLPKQIQLKEEIYRNWKEFLEDLEHYGGIVQACLSRTYDVISLGIFLEHDTANPVLIATSDIIQVESDIRTDIGYIIPQSKVSINALEKLADNVGKALLREQYIGFFGVDIVAFKNKSNDQELWVIDVDPFYTDLIAFNDWKMFCSKKCKCCHTQASENYAVCSGKLYITGLSKYCGEQLITFCGAQNIYYDHLEKSGCMLYPIDSENKTMFLFSLDFNRKLAIKKFIEALRALYKLSFEKPTDKIKSNMHQLAKELEKHELGHSDFQ